MGKKKSPRRIHWLMPISAPLKILWTNATKARKTPVGWYAFGRSQGLDTSFGKKILTSPMNRNPHFVVWERPEYTFYSGYCIKFYGDLNRLARCLNSDDMAFYINTVSRDYQHNYKSFAKSFLLNFPVPAPETQTSALVNHYSDRQTRPLRLFFLPPGSALSANALAPSRLSSEPYSASTVAN